MKSGNVKKSILKYHLTFNKLHIPLVALSQLFIAYYRLSISRYVNTEMGTPRSFILVYKQATI